MNKGVHVSFLIVVLSAYMPRSGIAGSYDNHVFSFLNNLHHIFHSLTIKQLHPTYIPTNSAGGFPLQNLPIVNFSVVAILTAVRQYLIVVLICISLIRHAEHIFMHLFTIPPLEKCLFRSSAHFLTGLFVCHGVILLHDDTENCLINLYLFQGVGATEYI